MYASIDRAAAKVEAQLLRYKNKMQDHHAKGLATVDMNVNVLSRPVEMEEDSFDDNEEVRDNFVPHPITTKKLRIKLIIWMELSTC